MVSYTIQVFQISHGFNYHLINVIHQHHVSIRLLYRISPTVFVYFEHQLPYLFTSSHLLCLHSLPLSPLVLQLGRQFLNLRHSHCKDYRFPDSDSLHSPHSLALVRPCRYSMERLFGGKKKYVKGITELGNPPNIPNQ